MNGLEELRQKVRYGHGNLMMSVKRAGSLWFLSRPRSADWMDYNHLGMAFESGDRFGLSSELLLQLDISDVKDVSLSKIVARVRNIARRSDRYRYGVEFDYEANAHMNSAEVKTSLTDIEEVLAKIFVRLKAED